MPTVLLADDDQELLTMYDLWLDQLEGVSVRTVTDGDEALERFDDAVDVAVLDRRMPKTPGDEVAETIRSRHPDCAVLIVSAFQPDDNIDDDAYDRYLTKPVHRDDMLEAIEREATELATTR